MSEAPIPLHHKEIAKHLRERFGEPASVFAYRDDHGQRTIPVGSYGPPTNPFYSTLGQCDAELSIPAGRYEFAATGNFRWLPNASVSAVFWLQERSADKWPLICEDAVRQNARSTYRHMAFIPSTYRFKVSEGPPVAWLLGVPLRDSELLASVESLSEKVLDIYPRWLGTDA